MGVIQGPSKIPFTDINALPSPGTSLVTYVLFNAQGQSSGQEFIWSDTANDYVPVGDAAYNVIGTWNASTNTPDYTTTLTTNGDALSVVTAGTTDVNNFNKWNTGDLLVRENDVFFRVPNQPDIISDLEDGDIPVYKQNALKTSSLTQPSDDVMVANNLSAESGTIELGPIEMSERGGFVATHTDTLNRDYIVSTYRVDDTTGTYQPDWFPRGPRENNQVIQSVNTETLTATNSFTIVPSISSDVQAIYLDFAQAYTDLKVRLSSSLSGNPIKYLPNRHAWLNDDPTDTERYEPGIDVTVGINRIPIQADTPLAVLTPFNVIVDVNQNIELKGDTNGNPYLATDRSPILATRFFTDDVIITDHMEPKLVEGTDIGITRVNDTLEIAYTGDANPTAAEIKTLYESNADTNAFTDSEQTKLSGIATGAEVNVQANWNETNNTVDSYIRNKPTIPTARTEEDIEDIIGAMVSGNTETGITVTYDDVNGKLNFVVTGTTGPPQAMHTNYLALTEDQVSTSVDTATALSSDDLNPTFTLPTFPGNRYIQILQSMAHTTFTSINIGGIDQFGIFTVNDNARIINGQAYRQYVTDNLLTNAFDNSTLIAGGAS